ncbi:MAG TPA: TetR family transcriptional regulator [Solirubrobacteraceae bacterium]
MSVQDQASVRPRRRPSSARAQVRGDSVAEVQRARMVAAALEAVADVGYARMTVAQVISRARVSRKTFGELFSDREDCFLVALEQTLEEARRHAAAAYASQSCWRDGTRAALATLLELIDQEPGLAGVCLVQALAGGERVLDLHARAVDELACAIDRGRALGPNRDPPSVAGEAIAGGVLAVLHTHLVDGRGEEFRTLLGPLMSTIVLPYLGVAAARKELGAEWPLAESSKRPRSANQESGRLAGLNMRVTYRTVRTLAVVAAHPGASNREIGERSGIIDEGQISRLLSRLAKLELLENRGAGQQHGCANAWHLTALGARLGRATSPRPPWGAAPGDGIG